MKYKKGDLICINGELGIMYRVAVVEATGPIYTHLGWYDFIGGGGEVALSQSSKSIRNREALELTTEKVGFQLDSDTAYIYGIPYKMRHSGEPTYTLPKYEDTAVI